MAENRRLNVSEEGNVTVVEFVDRKILDDAQIQEIGQEFADLVNAEGRSNMLLNFSSVEFLSSSALGKLINLNKQVKQAGGKLRMSNIRPEIMEVFAITKLNKLFDIREDVPDALAAFSK
ncbi:MAG: STAS domain-containing protein [Pirellulales bacterium]